MGTRTSSRIKSITKLLFFPISIGHIVLFKEDHSRPEEDPGSKDEGQVASGAGRDARHGQEDQDRDVVTEQGRRQRQEGVRQAPIQIQKSVQSQVQESQPIEVPQSRTSESHQHFGRHPADSATSPFNPPRYARQAEGKILFAGKQKEVQKVLKLGGEKTALCRDRVRNGEAAQRRGQ